MANYRGPSGTPGSYVLERLVDMAAAELSMDPTEIRRRNFISADAMPVKLANGQSYDCGEFEALMDKCITLADYKNIEARRKTLRQEVNYMAWVYRPLSIPPEAPPRKWLN